VVADAPDGLRTTDPDNVAAYGGNLVAETVAPCNAPLIAAAPELYEAARFAASVIRAQGLFDRSERMAVEKLEAAIAKAEGESNA
jgi:hypothetical protein